MKRTRDVLSGVSVLALCTLAGAPHALAAGFDWSGAYFGINAGFANNNSEVGNTVTYDPRSLESFANAIEADQATLIGGALLGYNLQLDRIVLGAEADLNYLGFSDSRSKISDLDIYAATSKTTFDASWFGTLRGRLGCTLGGFLVYGTAGLASGDMQATASVRATDVLTGQYGKWHGSADTLDWGWTAGAGVEYGISNVSFGVEYLYVDLGSTDWKVTSDGTLKDVLDTAKASASADYSFSVARATAKLRF